MRYSKAFSSLVITVMVFSMVFPPFAYAEETTPEAPVITPIDDGMGTITVCSGTTINYITDADRQRLWESTIGFTADEINDLNPQQNALQKAGTFENPMYLAVAPEGAEQTIDFRAFATLMGKTGEDAMRELALQLGVPIDRDNIIPNDARVLISRANLYAENQGKASVFMSKLVEWGFVEAGATQLPAASAPAYADFKITLPESGDEIALSDLFKLKKINAESCMLGDTMNGRVTYLGSLGDDIAYGDVSQDTLTGQYTNPSMGNPDEELISEMNQHFTADSMQGYLELNGGGNMLIPSFYENWLSHVGTMTNIQFYGSLLVGLGGASFSNKITSKTNLFQENLVLQRENLAAIPKGITIGDTPLFKNFFNRHISDMTTFTDEVLKSRIVKEGAGAALGIAERRLSTTLALGMGWLGPGRYIYSINEGLFLNSGVQNNQYVIIFANREVGKRFRSATDLWGLGEVSEALSKVTGGVSIPKKAFFPKSILILNKPLSSNERGDQTASTTTIRLNEGVWAITTQWQGLSHATNFEDLRKLPSREEFTSLAFVTNNMLPDAVINQAVKGNAYKALSLLSIPLVLSGGVFRHVGRIMGVSVALVGLEIATYDNDQANPEIECNKDYLDNYKSEYAWAVGLGMGFDVGLVVAAPFATSSSIALQTSKTAAALGLPVTKLSSTAKILARHSSGISTASSLMKFLNPFDAWMILVGNKAMEYVSNCKDSQYKVLTYQSLTEELETQTDTLGQLSSSLDDITSQLNIGSAVSESYAPVRGQALSGLQNILNFKAVMQDQTGAVSPSELLYVQVEESAWSVQGGLFDQLAGDSSCQFNENYAGDGLNFNLGEDGITVYNDDGSVRLSLNDYWNKVRALGRMRSQENARVILPNKIIDHSLNCQGPFIQIDYRANAVLSGNCGADCLKTAISMVTGREASNDLNGVIGTISSVDTDKGVASFAGDAIRFLVLYPGDDELFGEEVTAPGAEQIGLASRQELRASKLTIGVGADGVVGAELSGSGQPKRSIGSVKTIIGDKGKIEFSNGRMLLFVYSLAGTSAQNIRGLTSSLQDGEVNLGVQAKTGAEESGEELNAALDAIQGEGGMDVFETDDHIYYFDGENLRVIDKNTGEATDYAITGREDLGNGQYAFDTDQGQFRFGFDMQNGQPMLSAEGPNGLNEVLALLAARGDDGILTFNPSTGSINVYNGQDIPLSPEFASKGISFMGDENGRTRGVPANNPFTANWDTGGTSNRGGLNLPSWPENQLLVALMVSVVLIGVAFVRRNE